MTGGTLVTPASTEHAEKSRCRWWIDPTTALVFYLLAAVWFLWLAAGASAQGTITGEEASVTHQGALSVALHWQPSVWSTNFGGQVFYWFAGHLMPDYGLLYARPAKALATALLAPLCYLVARRRLDCRRASSAVAGVLVGVLPGVSMLAWLGIETPLDAVWGVAASYVVTSRRGWWPVGLVLVAGAVSTYAAGLAWAAAVVLVAATRVRSVRDGALVLTGAGGGLGVVLFPLVWWRNGGIVVTGGGHSGLDLSAIPARLGELARYAVGSGQSYYYFSSLPMLGGPMVAALLALCALVAAWQRFGRVWPWLAAATAGVGLYAMSSGVPGSRRVVVLAVVTALVAAVAVDVLARQVAQSRAATAVLAVIVAVVLAAPCVAGTLAWREEVTTGARTLPIDWPFPLVPGTNQAGTVARLDVDLQARRLTPTQVGDGWGGTRTLSMLYMLDQRTGRTPALTPDDILGYYRTSGDCQLLDGPAC